MSYYRPLFIAILIISTTVVYIPVKGFDFVWDDRINIEENTALNPVTFENIIKFWKAPEQNLYIPITYTVWSFLAFLSQYDDISINISPALFHWANIILHILNVLLVYSILRVITGNSHDSDKKRAVCQQPPLSELAPLTGALLFALHPLQVEAVTWITGMKDLLSSLFSFIALRYYIVFSTNSNPSKSKEKYMYYTAASTAFIFALLSKPSAVVIPVIAWIADIRAIGITARESFKRLFPWFLMTLPVMIVTKSVQSNEALDYLTPLWSRPLIALDAFTFYIYKLFLPITLTPDYGRTPEYVLSGNLLYFTCPIACVLLFLLLFKWRNRSIFTSALIFIAGILPVSGLIPFMFQNTSTVADRYVYISMVGSALAFSLLLINLKRRYLIILPIIVICLSGYKSITYASLWKDSFSLFNHALKINPHSYLSYNNLGTAFARTGRRDEAITYYMRAMELKPFKPEPYNNIGVLLSRQKRYPEAIDYFQRGLSDNPDVADLHYNMAIAFEKLGDYNRAAEAYGRAITLNPEDAVSHYRRGIVLHKAGREESAFLHFNRTLEIDVNNADMHYTMGNILVENGKNDSAVNHYKKAVTIDPGMKDSYYNIGNIMLRQNRLDESVKYYEMVLALKPNDIDTLINMGAAFIAMKRYDMAIEKFLNIISIHPGRPDVHNNLGVAYYKAGMASKAYWHYKEALRIDPGFKEAEKNLASLVKKIQ